MTTHELKIWPEYYEAVESGKKTFEFRYNDRDFQVGDYLVLLEWEPSNEKYTGRTLYAEITYMMGVHGRTTNDYVILAIKLGVPTGVALRMMWSVPMVRP